MLNSIEQYLKDTHKAYDLHHTDGNRQAVSIAEGWYWNWRLYGLPRMRKAEGEKHGSHSEEAHPTAPAADSEMHDLQ